MEDLWGTRTNPAPGLCEHDSKEKRYVVRSGHAKALPRLSYVPASNLACVKMRQRGASQLTGRVRSFKPRDLPLTLQGQRNVVQAFYEAVAAKLIHLE